MALPESLNLGGAGKPYVVEGIGYDFIPDVLVQKEVTTWLKSGDDESFTGVEQLIKMEGLLVGGSSGSALSGALHWLKTEEGSKVATTPGKNVVVILPDRWVSASSSTASIDCSCSIRNYMSKPWFLDMAMGNKTTPMSKKIGEISNKKEAPARGEVEPGHQ